MLVKRYHPGLVSLHWLLALLLVVALGMGSQVLAELPNTDPEKLTALMGHMIAGGLILLLTLVRLITRLTTAHPPAASTGMAWADRVAPLMHWVLYALVLAMAGSGIAMAVAFDLPGVVFNGVGSLPADFHVAPVRAVHGVVSKLLALMIVLHVAAALYHQFVKRDGLFSRMWYGRRN